MKCSTCGTKMEEGIEADLVFLYCPKCEPECANNRTKTNKRRKRR